MKVGAIIAAAGFGRRMKTDRPKQLLVLNDTPILVHTIRKFDACDAIDYVIVTAPRESVKEVDTLVAGAGFKKSVVVVEGGERRQDSVAIGLQHLQPGTAFVAVHDAVRPFVTAAEIESVIRQAERTGAAILAVPIVDTVKQAEKELIESSLVERLGHPVAIVRGSERNIKITRPTDLTLARVFLEEEKSAH